MIIKAIIYNEILIRTNEISIYILTLILFKNLCYIIKKTSKKHT